VARSGTGLLGGVQNPVCRDQVFRWRYEAKELGSNIGHHATLGTPVQRCLVRLALGIFLSSCERPHRMWLAVDARQVVSRWQDCRILPKAVVSERTTALDKRACTPMWKSHIDRRWHTQLTGELIGADSVKHVDNRVDRRAPVDRQIDRTWLNMAWVHCGVVLLLRRGFS
jgi:hypothetical protein